MTKSVLQNPFVSQNATMNITNYLPIQGDM